MTTKHLLILSAGLLATLSLLAVHAAPPTTAPAEKNTDTLYLDPSASSSAVVSQILPSAVANASTAASMNLTNVKRITVTQEILVIEWGATSTTILPRQFVSSITLNKRTPAAAPTLNSNPNPSPYPNRPPAPPTTQP
jgi:hypothetical protein